tara:strand:- start:2422 stop:2643 length:222 start_codon:yes stop_codon:yes gene_type:complete
MNNQEFLTAMNIIGQHHSTKVIINQPINGSVGDLGHTKWSIHITDCCASVFNKLRAAEFSLSMENGMTSISKY